MFVAFQKPRLVDGELVKFPTPLCLLIGVCIVVLRAEECRVL